MNRELSTLDREFGRLRSGVVDRDKREIRRGPEGLIFVLHNAPKSVAKFVSDFAYRREKTQITSS
jgi:hypothetical protein